MIEGQMESQLDLIYLNGTAYVFSDNDYMKLRSEYRIIGKFIGTLNSRGYPSFSNSIPVELTKFETQLLLEKRIANLLNKNMLAHCPNPVERQEFLDVLEKRINEQKEHFINCKVEQSKLNIGKILFGRKKKLEESGKNITISEDQVLQEIRSGIKFKRHNALLDIPYEHLSKHDAKLVIKFPSQDDSFKYRIFKDIWEKGYFITSGEAFGADFIVYQGDPLIYHASYIIIAENNTRTNICDIVAKCRLSVTVNKIFIYAYQNYIGNLLYHTISWEGHRGKSSF